MKFIDLTNKIFGNFLVVNVNKEKSKTHTYWDCKCLLCNSDKLITIRSDHLTKGTRIDCGCSKDLTGKVFGKLKVIEKDIERTKKKLQQYYFCDCECGNKHISFRASTLNNGTSKSCGKCSKNTFTLVDGYYICYDSNDNYFYIDIDDYGKVSKYTWIIDSNYVTTTISNKKILLHRFIMNVNQKNVIVDHINGNPYDNRKCNLRICSQSNNSMNRKLSIKNMSGFTGVQFNKKSNKWYSKISVNGKHIFLGSYNNIEDAINARKNAEIKYFGEYSYDYSRNKNIGVD